MKRKLINYEIFERIQNDSLSTAASELHAVAPVLAKTLGVSELKLANFGADDVMYETADGTFVHASFDNGPDYITFDNIEQLVINEETEVKKAKSVLGNMLEALLDDNKEKAEAFYKEYFSLPNTKRKLFESKKKAKKSNPFVKEKDKGDKEDKKPHLAMCKDMKKLPKKKVALKEWRNLSKNVKDFVDLKTYGPTLSESTVQRDDNGNVTAVRIPSSKLRTEAKILSFNWKTMNTDVKVLRGSAKRLSENQDFCKAVVELKRYNALSDDAGLETTLENIVGRHPEVLYLTQEELAKVIGSALEFASVKSYDDQMCEFMAEGILRVAHNSYVDRVDRVMKLARVDASEAQDKYIEFQRACNEFYPSLDESNRLEMQVYVDLYETLRHIYKTAHDDGNFEVKQETASHLNDLHPIVSLEVEPDLEVARAAAEWLAQIVETNLDGGTWDVSNSVHITTTGEHPAMAQKAKQGYSPAADASGDWGDSAPVSDGKNYKGGLADEMRGNSWGNIANNDTYPSITNPYIPKPFGSYEIKGEKTVDADSNQLAHSGGGDTWPALQNPYVPKSVTPIMNHGKEADLIVNK